MVSWATFQSTKWHLATFGVLLLVLVFNAYVVRLNIEDAIDFDKYSTSIPSVSLVYNVNHPHSCSIPGHRLSTYHDTALRIPI